MDNLRPGSSDINETTGGADPASGETATIENALRTFQGTRCTLVSDRLVRKRAGRASIKPTAVLDRMISAKADNESRRRGHTVTRKPGTRTHVYRDPRWDERRLQLMNDINGERTVVGDSHWGGSS